MNPNSKVVLEERKKHFKMLLTPMSLKGKKTYLSDLPDQDLIVLSGQFEADEDYEICEAIKAVLDERESDKNSNFQL